MKDIPIRPSKDSSDFIAEDDQGYNFSFPTRETAEAFRYSCLEFEREISSREKRLVSRFREELHS